MIGPLIRGGMAAAKIAGRGGAAAGKGAAAGVGATAGALRLGIGAIPNLGWSISAWADLFARYYPTLSNTVVVRAQGSPTTPGNTVVHLALAAAYGCVSSTKLSRVQLKVTINHTANAVEVTYTVGNIAFIDAIDAVMRQFDGSSTIKGGNDKSAFERFMRDVGDIAGTNEFAEDLGKAINKGTGGGKLVPGVGRLGGPADPNTVAAGNNNLNQRGADPAANAIVRKAIQIYRAASLGLGQGIVYRLGRHDIKGGRSPSVLAPDIQKAGRGLLGLANKRFLEETAKPFTTMAGEVLLTRDPAANPQPPDGTDTKTGQNGFGTDLRTLVAQALYDPGFRPPYPQTHQGPPPIETEELGR